MSKDDDSPGRALDKWRAAEEQYQREASRFTAPADGLPRMTKDDLVGLVQLRGKADRWRERYFKRQRG